MKKQSSLRSIASVIITIFLSGCVPSNPSEITPTLDIALQPTQTPYHNETPTVCSGWNCSLEGVIYADKASLGNELAGVKVHLEQISWCSPTKGEYETISDNDGKFRFAVYLHDTDTFWTKFTMEGFQPVRQAIGGFDCLHCECLPIEIILLPTE